MNKSVIPGIALAFLILATSFSLHYSDDSFWQDNLDPDNTLENKTQIYTGLKFYFSTNLYSSGKTEFLNGFSQNEKSHLKDVKILLDTVKLLALISTITLLTSLAYLEKKELFKALFIGGSTSLTIILVIGAAAIINFESFWKLLHEVLFPQGNWKFALDSTLGLLFLQGNFFEEFAHRFLITSFLLGTIPTVLGYWKK